jgi:hypothetical protein
MFVNIFSLYTSYPYDSKQCARTGNGEFLCLLSSLYPARLRVSGSRFEPKAHCTWKQSLKKAAVLPDLMFRQTK